MQSFYFEKRLFFRDFFLRIGRYVIIGANIAGLKHLALRKSLEVSTIISYSETAYI